MKDETLNRMRAEGFTDAQLKAELDRIDRMVAAMGGPAGHKPGSAGHKLMLRRAIYQSELVLRTDSVAQAMAATRYVPGRFCGD